ncbi:hypothetical protein CVIRNUC_003035 [Coccomyxa viridis]|uniref:Uncharacterized protein n=1 Tax=Coccomyxa viridis TaxID=1274662 RepID=A0AAV1I049_9CHLO|nr:hypothetical protein CVIRNUC_003035 [Coccomyxa viridis]
MTAKETAEKKMNGYKRLGFVSDYTTFAWTKSTDIASGVYDYSKGFMPKSLSPTVEHWEKKVSEIGSPLLAKLHDNSDYMLHAVDDTVDTTLKKSGEYVDSSKKAVSSQVNSKMNLHTDNLKWFDEARGKFSSRLVGSVEYVKKEGFQGTAQTAVGLVANALEDAKQLPSYLNKETKELIHRLSEAYDKVKTYPAVQKLMATFQPSVDFAKDKYGKAHDVVVSNPRYAGVYKNLAGAVDKLSSTVKENKYYQATYSRISPYADPAYESIEPYVEAAHSHLKPVSMNGKA